MSSVRRRASVGCAVSTSPTDNCSTDVRARLSGTPARRRMSTASATDPSRWPWGEARARVRSRRTRCFSSARFASWKYNPKARMSTSARGRSMASISAANARRSSALSDRRRAMAARRMRSTRSSSSTPSCSTMTSPRSAPRSLTSRARGSLAPAVPMPRGSARTAAFGRVCLVVMRDRLACDGPSRVPCPARHATVGHAARSRTTLLRRIRA